MLAGLSYVLHDTGLTPIVRDQVCRGHHDPKMGWMGKKHKLRVHAVDSPFHGREAEAQVGYASRVSFVLTFLICPTLDHGLVIK